jgi:hypothetical protein
MTSLNFDITRRIGLDYSTESNVLRVEFKNGSIYDYREVPVYVAAPGLTLEFDTAGSSSFGRWFAFNIKPVFPCKKIASAIYTGASA